MSAVFHFTQHSFLIHSSLGKLVSSIHSQDGMILVSFFGSDGFHHLFESASIRVVAALTYILVFYVRPSPR